MGEKVGTPIPAAKVVSKSAGMVLGTPTLMLPQVAILVLGLIGDVATRISIVTSILTFIASFIVQGAYPSLVKAALAGGPLSVGESLRQALPKFLTLLIAGIVVGVVVVLGFIAIIVPGIILASWYAYTVPAIMLENKGALDGMAASKAFGRDKKWSTFIMLLCVGLVAVVIALIDTGLSFASPLLGRVVDSLLAVPLYAWIAVIFSYTYITYGPQPETATAEAGFGSAGNVPPPPPAPEPAGHPSPIPSPPTGANFCMNCGSPLQPGSRFCTACGMPV